MQHGTVALQDEEHDHKHTSEFAFTKWVFKSLLWSNSELQSAIEWANSILWHTMCTHKTTLISLVSNFMHDSSYLFLIPKSIFRYFTAAAVLFFLLLFYFYFFSSVAGCKNLPYFFGVQCIFFYGYSRLWIGNCVSSLTHSFTHPNTHLRTHWLRCKSRIRATFLICFVRCELRFAPNKNIGEKNQIFFTTIYGIAESHKVEIQQTNGI